MKIIGRNSLELELPAIMRDLTADATTDQWDIAFLFVSQFNKESTAHIATELRKKINCHNFVGCSCAGVITSNSEVERQPAISLILMKFEHVIVQPFYLTQSEIGSMTKNEEWYEFLDVYPTEKPKFLILPDPFSIDITQLLTSFNKAYALCPVIGGLASAGSQAGDNTLILNDKLYEEGCVGLSLQGDIRIETVVSQGCRPIGESYIVTRGEGNIIYELGGRPFYKVLEEVISKGTDRDRTLAQEAIFVGISMDEYKHELRTGDFLIRMLVGLDQQSGAGAIADYISTGQTIQFHVRDAVSATHELTELMDTQMKRHPKDQLEGALLFSCNGRGQGLFGVSDHDLNILKNHVGDLPVAGFFCAGEVGPVGGQNFVHGFTSSIALFYSNPKPVV